MRLARGAVTNRPEPKTLHEALLNLVTRLGGPWLYARVGKVKVEILDEPSSALDRTGGWREGRQQQGQRQHRHHAGRPEVIRGLPHYPRVPPSCSRPASRGTFKYRSRRRIVLTHPEPALHSAKL